ncbi:MAG: hypothetical protein ACKO23_01825 [Gemmataceae bacterium]
MSSASQYEFNPQENELIGGLASKMSFVGLFFLVIGIIYLLTAVMVIPAIVSDKVPADWAAKTQDYLNKLPDDVRKQAEEHMASVPPRKQLWTIAFNAGLIGFINLLIGVWTRNAASEFKQVVTTQGQDVSHLMKGLGSLNNMYTLLYSLLIISIVSSLLFVALSLLSR